MWSKEKRKTISFGTELTEEKGGGGMLTVMALW
jgi:hypothetical protein